MNKTERSLTLVGWVVPGSQPHKQGSRNRSRSRSNSILQHQRASKDQRISADDRDEIQRRSVTIVEGRQRMLLLVDDALDHKQPSDSDKQVPFEVDMAISGAEG